jgi:hypothetical protein
MAVISAGHRNRFRHPHPETLDRLQAAGARVFRTDMHGAVTVELTRDGTVVRPFVGEAVALAPGAPPAGPAEGEASAPDEVAGPDDAVAAPDLP